MQGDLISREALLAELNQPTAVTSSPAHNWMSKAMHDIMLNTVRNAPAVDAAPVVHGVWIGSYDGYADGYPVYDIWECSNCGFDADGADEKPDWNFCPNCGAKMDLPLE